MPGRASPTWLFDFLYQVLTVCIPLFVEIGRHSLRVFKSNLNDTRVSLRLYQRNQRQVDCPDQVPEPRLIVHKGSPSQSSPSSFFWNF
jgi:hypothetical protein